MITTITFGKSFDALESPGFKSPLLASLNDALPSFTALKFFPVIFQLLALVPLSLMSLISSSTAQVIQFQGMLLKSVLQAKENLESLKTYAYPVIFRNLLDPSTHTEGDIPLPDLLAEAQAMVTGGIENVANTVMYGVYHVTQDSEMNHRLQEEICEVWPDPQVIPDLADLESLPFLTAVIKESLRLAPGLAAPLPRIVPPQGAVLDGRFIPGGVSVSVHHVS